MNRQISLATIREAAEVVYDVAVRTPVVRLEVPGLAHEGPEIFLKLETLQPIGSFKIRGAQNAVRHLSAEQLAGGVWTVSAGNAAQGVALAARKAGAPCSVLVMDTAPDTKLRSIKRLGATIVQAPYEECWKTVEHHSSDRMHGQLVHPFDDDRFISGNGTIALEIHQDVPDVDAVIAPIGGGGLIAGIGAALRELKPDTRIYAAEPETAAPLEASLRSGKASVFEAWTKSFVDGAGGRSVIPTMWPLLKDVALGLLTRTQIFLKRAGTIILGTTIILWALASFPHAGSGQKQSEVSIAGRIASGIETVVRPIGFNHDIALALLPAMAAREVAVSAIATVYSIDSPDEKASATRLENKLQHRWSLATALAFLAWFVFAPQCISTIAVTRRETNGWKWPLFMVGYLFVLAYAFAGLTYWTAVALGL